MDIGTTLLEYGADTNAVTRQGISPIHLAAQEGSVDLVSLLLTKSANVNVCNKVYPAWWHVSVWLCVSDHSIIVRSYMHMCVLSSYTERTYTTPLSSSGGQGQCCRSPSQPWG